ncbi:hypothetical protein QLQ86_12315 [Halomonas sp. LR5S13]|uniref:hypothetical protein n=1 Tax=Halomonas rhizosphaerae TaxID=3043296 RepID=UPI0024A897C7|nr:hypothetical protein [Halomonas rhizosphaerae]MDI5921575.1 hypothetical protein [Halomonas rhizosphaerae]
MKQQKITTGLLALCMALSAPPLWADSAMEQRFREEGRQLDLTRFLRSDNDARSRSFLYGSVHEHDFTVKEAGTYRFESSVPGGESDSYRVEAVLLDGEGRVVARGEGLGESGGLALRQRLEPGDYVLQVQGRKFGSVRRDGNSFYISVIGLDVEDDVSSGDGIAFIGNRREGGRTAFVRRSDAVAAVAAPSAATGQAERSEPVAPNADSPAESEGSVARREPAPAAADAEPSKGFEEIVTDVKIRARGEVLTFEVLEAGTVAITTATFPGNEGTYRIEAEVLDEQGRVVAQDAGEGFDGDVDLRTELEPGRYRVRVQGQKFAGSGSGVNNYELKVRQLDRR